MPAFVLLLLTAGLNAAEHRAPAGTQPAARRPGADTVLPGGRILSPLGRHFRTGPGPFGIAVSPKGDLIVTADGGPNRYSLTVWKRDKNRDQWTSRTLKADGKRDDDDEEDQWRSVFQGLAFESPSDIWVSEGETGRVRLMSPDRDAARFIAELNQGGYRDSYSGDLAVDPQKRLLYVLDQANFRMAVIDTERRRIVGSVRVGRLPFAIALAPDGKRVFVTNVGMYEYRRIPGADKDRARETGLPFPAFGFPSPESRDGVRRETESGPVDVPGLGDPNAREANSLAVINVENPAAPRVEKFLATGLPLGAESAGGSSPSGVLVAAGRVFVTNANQDTIDVFDAATLAPGPRIALRIPGLEPFRGILPIGLAWHEGAGRLLVAEAGINAVGVVDGRSLEVLGHIPTAWFPTRLAVFDDMVHVACAKGFGTGPNATKNAPLEKSFQADLRSGEVMRFIMPKADELPLLTARVLEVNGFTPAKTPGGAFPPAIRYVVFIVKENRTFDEVLGDVASAANGPVNGAVELARFGRYGRVRSQPGGLRQRPITMDVNVTPNHHAIAGRWALSDNFYTNSEVSVDGHHWAVGAYPNAWTESSVMAAYGGQKQFRFPTTAPGRLHFAQSASSMTPENTLEGGALWHHLERNGISFRNYGEGFELAGIDEGPGLTPTGARFLTNIPMPEVLYRNTSRTYPGYNMNIPDQYRATQFIAEIEEKYLKGGESFPRLLYLHLPNDHIAKPRPEDGYLFDASYVADNDLALGRILEFLSRTPQWRNMAVIVTEDDAQGGVDHVDSHRSLLLIASPYAKQNYVSHQNTSFPSILKTIFHLLGLPTLNLYDATATDLADCFSNDSPDFAPYELQAIDPRLFDPTKARAAQPGTPSPSMDDPNVLREQHRR